MQRLAPEQMAEIVLAALSNARRLLDDAVLMTERGRTPTAFLLVGLAADELGKHVMVASFYGMRQESDDDWKKFWRRFRTHQEKLGDALWAAWAGDLLTEDPPPDVEAFHRRRLASTYVDVDDNGCIATPQSTVTTAELEEALARIKPELEFCERGFGAATPSALGAAFSRMRDSENSEQVREIISDLGPMGSLAYVIASRGGASHDAAVQFASTMSAVLRKADGT
jgi:AbiV family abortive infection protein